MKKSFFTTLIFAFTILSSTAQTLTTGLEAYWQLNGNYTNTGAASITTTNVGSTSTANNVNVTNSAMAFANGVPPAAPTQYATFPVTSSLNFTATNDFTVSHNFKINSLANGKSCGFFDYGINYGGYGTWAQRSGGTGPIQVIFNFRNKQLLSLANINLNTWYNLTCVKTGTNMLLYINGIQVSTISQGTSTPFYLYDGRIGTMSAPDFDLPQYNGLNGAMDELRVYSRALSAAEVTSLASVSLPLKLNNFTASLQQNKTTLSWQTLEEQNTSHFIVERSADGLNFIGIKNVNAAGNSTAIKDYTYIDDLNANLLQLKTIYYRLKMVDVDQSYKISKIVAIKLNEKSNTITLLPNPASSYIQVQTNVIGNGLTNFTIVDISGKVVFEKQEKLNQATQVITIPVLDLQAGIYILKIKNNTTQLTKQFIKSN